MRNATTPIQGHGDGFSAGANYNPIESFRDAMIQVGLEPPSHIEADGVIHRFHHEGDRRSTKNAWYCLHLDGVPAGVFSHWKTGITHHWSAKSKSDMTRQELDAHRQQMEQARRQRAELDRRAHEQAAIEARSIWGKSGLAHDDHPYLVRKGVTAGIAKQSRGALILPILSFSMDMRSLQFIQPDGSKKLLTGGQKKGNFTPCQLVESPSRILICEGWATGRTLAELDPTASVLAAIDAGNLESVAANARAKWPNTPLVIAGDDDRQTEGNPGRTKANAAAIASGAALMFPQWHDDMPMSLSDFNDWHLWIKRQGGAA